MFFTGLSELMQEGQIINLNLIKKDGRLFVSLMPKVQDMPESAKNKLIPLNVNGTPGELDEAFLETISQPVQERFGLISNAELFKENTKSVVSKKVQGSGSNQSPKPESKLSKSDRQIVEAEAHEKAGRWPEAYAIYKKVSAADPDNTKLKEKVMEVWSKMAQRPLFGSGEDEIKVEEEASTTVPGENIEALPDTGNHEKEDIPLENNTPKVSEPDKILVSESKEQVSAQLEEKPAVDMFAQIMGIANHID